MTNQLNLTKLQEVNKAGDGVFVDAKLVQQTASETTWDIEYAEDGSVESGIPLSRLQKKKEPAEGEEAEEGADRPPLPPP